MTNYHEERARALRCKAEAIEKSQETIQVDLSVTAAWLLRDLIGLGPKTDISLTADMDRLNLALGHRAVGEPHVSGWSAEVVEGMHRR